MRLNQLVLTIAKCPEEYTGSKHIEMPEEGGSIGRNPSCTLTLADHNRFISGTHCLISVYGDTYYISDVSTNGILINGNKVLRNQPVSLYEGDAVTLGQYEMHVVFEQIALAQDIAADIAPERDSSDPLVNLGEPVVEEELQVGSLEELFMETKPDEIDGQDPITHLNFSMQRDDDFLIQDEEHRKPQPAEPIDNRRQIVDDSFSIDSEFDIPNLIPEDWLGAEKTASAPPRTDNHPPQEKVFVEPAPHVEKQPNAQSFNAEAYQAAHTVKAATQQTVQTGTPTQSWEEVTLPFEPKHQAESSEASVTPSVNVEPTTIHTETPPTSGPLGMSEAFFQGLGISEPELVQQDEQFFKHMGMCLRLCMDSLQKELNDVETLKQDGESQNTTANLTELMLTLSSQKLLAPHELIEQMLDELSDHRVLYERAISDFLVEQINACEPKKFEHDFSNNKKFASKSKLWSAYTAHYDQNRLKFNDHSVKKLIKENYEKIVQEKHA